MINIQDLTEWEYRFLKYYLDKFNAKWVRVFNNKHPLLATRVDLQKEIKTSTFNRKFNIFKYV